VSVRQALLDVLQSQPQIAAAYLFGSVARGTATGSSDVDVGILLEHAPPPTLEGIPADVQDRLTEALGRPVDVIILNDAAPDLIHRVLRDGELILDQVPALRIRFEVRARNEYFDLLPVLEEYRRPRASSR
jgi:predicted nucleotidyltransferase